MVEFLIFAETKHKLMDNIIFEKKEVREAWNQKVLDRIAAAEKDCTPFPIGCYQYEGVWGIWFQSGDEFLLVNPIELVSSVFADDEYYLLEYYKKEHEGQKPKGHYYVIVHREDHAYHWKMAHSELAFSESHSYTFNEYQNKTNNAINALYQAWSKNEPVAYDEKSDVTLEALEICKKQVEIKAVLPSKYVLMNASVQEEPFHFQPDDKWNGKYAIGIGNRQYKTILTDWDNDLERIRHQLETYVYERKAELTLSFDMSDTIVIFKKESVLDQINETTDGYGYKYKDYALVEVHPNEFVNKPVLKGYCNEKEAIRTMYEGLMLHAMRLPLEKKQQFDNPPLMVAYNKIKSPLIEAFLKDEHCGDEAYSIRQVHVEHVLTICPDYDQLYIDEEKISGDLDELYDKEGKPIQMDELVEWQQEINPIIVASATGDDYSKDWPDYHKRGWALSKQLRERLTTDFDLWYDCPWEDKSGTVKKKHLVF